MGEILIPKDADTSEPLSQRWGLSGHYALCFPIATSISEGGLCHDLGLKLAIAESFTDSYTLGLEATVGKTEGKLFPTTTAGGTTTENSHWDIQFGFGHISRKYPYFNDSGDYVANLSIGQTPLIGGGKTTVSPSELGEVSATTWDIGTKYSFMGEFRPWGRGPILSVGPVLDYGVQYEDEDSEFNRVNLSLMLALQIGYGDASVCAGTDADTEPGPMGIAQGFYSLFHGWALRFAMDKALSEPQDALNKYGLPTSSTGDRGSQADLPVLEAGAAFLGGTSSSATAALRSPPWAYWTLLTAQALGGGLFLGLGSDASKGAGLADLLGVVRPLTLLGVESPSARRSKDDDTIMRRDAYGALVNYLLSALVMSIGAAAESDIAMSGGAGATFQVAMNPDLLGRRKGTDISLVPTTGELGPDSGPRVGIIVKKSYPHWPLDQLQLFFSAMLLSPMFLYDTESDSEVIAAAGLEWVPTPYTSFSVGPATTAVFGSKDTRIGLGGTVGIDIIIPISNGLGILLGAKGIAYKGFPEGWQAMVAPHIGLKLPF